MKIVYLIFAGTVALAGCAANLMSHFDIGLYDHLVNLSVTVDQASTLCGTPAMYGAVKSINRESKLATKYVTYTDRDVANSLELVDKAITEMADVYGNSQPSVTYCQLKIRIIQRDLDVILTGVGDKNK